MVKGLIQDNPIRKLKVEDMNRMSVGQRFWNVTMASIPDESSVKEPLQKWINNIKYNLCNGVGLLLFGSYGQGKTSAAVIAMKNTVVRGGTAYLIRGNQLKDAIINNLQFDSDETIKERTKSVDLLVLDDLGSEHDSAFNISMIEEILRDRSDNKKATIITTNLSGPNLKSKFGESLVSFLSATLISVECAGHDFRAIERTEIKNIKNNGGN